MSDSQRSSTSPTPRERAARVWTVGAAVIVALIVLAGLVVVFATRGGDDNVPPPAADPEPAAAGSSAPPAGASPPLPTLDQTVPEAPPPGVTWSLFQGVALPSSPTAGPARVDGPVHAGYAHTPTGALLAAANLSTRYLITPGDGWRQVVQQQVLPGPGRDVYEQARAKVTDEAPPGTYGQIAGFRFVTYSPDDAVIQFVSRFSDGTLQLATITVRWANGDWRLEMQADGGTSPTNQQVSSLAGYVPWGGI